MSETNLRIIFAVVDNYVIEILFNLQTNALPFNIYYCFLEVFMIF